VLCLCCVCRGIHPDFTGQRYLDILAAAKAGAPDIHVHAFSPLEVTHVSTAFRAAAVCGTTTKYTFVVRSVDVGVGVGHACAG
jgi:hypothetical protein